MNRLVIIGNGFDLAHGLKTRYEDFINWYWDYRVNGFVNNGTNISSDCLSTFESLTQEEKNLLKIVSQHHNQDFSQWVSEISSDY